MNRREAHLKRHHLHHMRMRMTAVVRQENQSSREGPDDSRQAQKAQTNLKARKAL